MLPSRKRYTLFPNVNPNDIHSKASNKQHTENSVLPQQRITTVLPHSTLIRAKVNGVPKHCYILEHCVVDGSLHYNAETTDSTLVSFPAIDIIETIKLPHDCPASPEKRWNDDTVNYSSPPRPNHQDIDRTFRPTSNYDYRGLRDDEFQVFIGDYRVVKKVKETDLLQSSFDSLSLPVLNNKSARDFYHHLRLHHYNRTCLAQV